MGARETQFLWAMRRRSARRPNLKCVEAAAATDDNEDVEEEEAIAAEGARRHLRRLEGEEAVCRVEGQRCLRWLQALKLKPSGFELFKG